MFTQDAGVVSVTIDRGSDNLLTGAMCAALTDFLLEPPPDAHVLVLSARGQVFCRGRERAAETPHELREEVDALIALNKALSDTPLVTVARVQGDAAGFGVGLAALCRVTLASPSARFWFPEVEIGLAPAVVLAWLPRLVGQKQAFHLTATGRPVTAPEAAALGLVTAVAQSDDALDAMVQDEVDALAKHSPRVHAEIGAFIRVGAEMTQAGAYDLAAEKLIVGSMTRRTAQDRPVRRNETGRGADADDETRLLDRIDS